MRGKRWTVWTATVAVLVLCSIPAMANQLDRISLNWTCNDYTFSYAASDLMAGHSYTIQLVTYVGPTGIGFPPITSIPFTATSSTYAGTLSGVFPLSGTVWFGGGYATLTGDGTTYNTELIDINPTSIDCPTTTPPLCIGANSNLISNLGMAGPANFTVLSLGGSRAVVNLNLASVTGNVGMPNWGSVIESAPSSISGDFVVGSSVNTTGVKGAYGTIRVDDVMLSQAVQDANAAAAYFGHLSATPSVQAQFPANGQIAGTLNVTGTAGLNVVNLPAFALNSGNLTLSGPAGAAFVFNIAGNFRLQSGNIKVSGGMGPLDVVFNILSPTATVTTMVPTTGVGILLAPNNTINAMDSSTFTGEIIGGFGKTIVLMSGTKVKNPCE